MFRRHRGARGPARGVVVVAVAAAIGAILLVAGRGQPGGGTARLAATQTSITPIGKVGPTAVVPAPAAATQVVVDPTTIPDAAPGATVLAAAAAGTVSTVASAGEGSAAATTTTTSAAAPVVDPGTSTTAPATTSSTTPPTTTTTTTTTTAPAGPARTPGVEADVVPLTNGDRTAASLVPLTRDACLDAAAAKNAEQMARTQVLAHDPGSGPAVLACHPGGTWGDNVGTDRPCSASYLEQQWMASPPHRENILTPIFRSIGVGAWTDAQGGCWVQVLFSS